MDDPREKDARKILRDILDYTKSVNDCQACHGPDFNDTCHSKRWKAIERKIKSFLATAPN